MMIATLSFFLHGTQFRPSLLIRHSSSSSPSPLRRTSRLFIPLALAQEITPPPPPPPQPSIETAIIQQQQQSTANVSPFAQSLLVAPKPQNQASSDLPDGSQWRYSEFLNAVKKGKVERVRFSKDGSVLQLTAVDGSRATVIVPNDPNLTDILAMSGVDISVSEGEAGSGLLNFIGSFFFPLLAFGGLFFLFRRAQGGPGGPGGLGGPMDFGRSVEVPGSAGNRGDLFRRSRSRPSEA